MPEVTSHRRHHASLTESHASCDDAGSPPGCPPAIRSRIGADLAGGFYPAPHRYHLYLSAGCPRSLRVAITLDLLGLRDAVTTTLLSPDTASATLEGLHGYYEATEHHFDGPLTVPALCDRWSGHVVSNHTPDIVRDLACRLAAHGEGLPLQLRPSSLAARIDAWHDQLTAPLTPATLEHLNRRLAFRAYLVGDELTAADVDLWARLVHEPPGTTAAHPDVRAYVRRLHDHPSFRANHPRIGEADHRAAS
ncbi:MULTISPECIES: cell envelope biogenesis protein OmpA [Streptomyces]